MILKGFGFVAFFTGLKASSFSLIHEAPNCEFQSSLSSLRW